MLPTLTSELRIALILGTSTAYLGWHPHDAFAKKHANDDSDDGNDDGEEDDGGGDKGDDEDSAEEDKEQPPVTAGGLFTISTYPVSEIMRPLTLTTGVTQMRLGLGTDLSAKGAFDSFGVSLEAQYGYSDNFTVIGGFTDAYNFRQYSVYFGFEGALAYDLFDIRLAANIHRNALPIYGNFCDPPVTPDEMPVGGTCQNPTAIIEALPSGKYSAGDTQFSIDLGFPFRYAIRPEVAIVALQTLMSIDFNSIDRDHIDVQTPIDPTTMATTFMTVRRGNSAKPDLKPSIGLATNPIPQLSLVVFAQLRIPDFDTAAGAFQVPVTGRIEASPNQKLDFGLEFTLLNVKPPEGQSPIDNRFLSLFMQARY
jgi:hypothetical protein